MKEGIYDTYNINVFLQWAVEWNPSLIYSITFYVMVWIKEDHS